MSEAGGSSLPPEPEDLQAKHAGRLFYTMPLLPGPARSELVQEIEATGEKPAGAMVHTRPVSPLRRTLQAASRYGRTLAAAGPRDIGPWAAWANVDEHDDDAGR